jgi:hypothetical protein
MLNVFGVRDACLRQPASYPHNQDEADFLARRYRDDPNDHRRRRPWWIDDDYEQYRVLYNEFLLALPTKNDALLDEIINDLCENKYVTAKSLNSSSSSEYRKLLMAMVESRR